MSARVLALFAIVTPGAAWAESDGLRGFTDGGFYVRADAGFSMESDQRVTETGFIDYLDPLALDVSLAGSGDVDLPDGGGFSIGAGWTARNSGLRLEALFVHDRRDDATLGYETQIRSSGLYGLVLYDFDALTRTQPFLGAGVGFNNVEVETDILGEQSDVRLSYIATAGMGFVINDRLVGDISYRYQLTPDLNYQWLYTDPDPIDGVTISYELEGDLAQQSVMFGLRYTMQKPAE